MNPIFAIEKAKFLCFMYRHRDYRGIRQMLMEIDAALWIL